MFSSVGLFSHLPCPEQDSGRCRVLNCLFSHQQLCSSADQNSQSSIRTSGFNSNTNSASTSALIQESDKPDSPSIPSDKTAPTPMPSGSGPSHIDPDTPFLGCLVRPPGPAQSTKKRSLEEQSDRDSSAPPSQSLSSNSNTKKPRLQNDQNSSTTSQTPKSTPSQQENTGTKVKESVTSSASPDPPKAPSKAPQPPPSARPLPTTGANLIPANRKSTQVQPTKPESLNPRLIPHNPVGHSRRHTYLTHLHTEMKRLNDEATKRATKDPRWKAFALTPQQLIKIALDEEQALAEKHGMVYPNMIKQRIFSIHKMTLQEWLKSRREKRKDIVVSLNPSSTSTNGSQSSTHPTTTTVQTSTKTSLAAKEQDSFKKHKVKTDLKEDEEIHILRHSLLSGLDALAPYGYVITPPTDQEIETARRGVEANRGWEECDRCNRRFEVFPARREGDGALTSGGSCTYHWGRATFPPHGKNRVENTQRFTCCQGPMGSEGCCIHPTHVFKVTSPKRLALVMPFQTTPDNARPVVATNRAIALDCEMAYSTLGMELVRVTVVSWPEGDQLVDALVRPLGQMLDFNTRFSGITPDQFLAARHVSVDDILHERFGRELAPGSNTNPALVAVTNNSNIPILSSPLEARKLVFSLITPQTPIIGHGLENDLNSLRIVHEVISDTVVLFPHTRGLPFRRTLRHLAEEQLGWMIQQANSTAQLFRPVSSLSSNLALELPSQMRDRIKAEREQKQQESKKGKPNESTSSGAGLPVGHDSMEDARAAGELVRKRVETVWAHLRHNGWTITADGLKEPVLWVKPVRRAGGSAALVIKPAPGPTSSAIISDK